jgi:hypothetical protein
MLAKGHEFVETVFSVFKCTLGLLPDGVGTGYLG